MDQPAAQRLIGIRDSVIGDGAPITTPFGTQPFVYAFPGIL